ncbi:MAG: hypothetical protein CL885_01975 [Dehalococcoidia bacterium]|nr:hypothetical protein [Dehalococcoidia bacterium]
MLGNMLNGREQQFLATRDELTSTWRILNTWHDSLKRLNPDDDIPDDSPAVTILTEGAYIALVTESARQGLLENMSFSNYDDYAPTLQEKEAEIQSLQAEIQSLRTKIVKHEEKPTHSEGFDLKTRAMDSIVKLAAMGDMSDLTLN